jgi:hypothetical protein
MPHSMMRIISMLCTANATMAWRFRRASRTVAAVKKATSHLLAMELVEAGPVMTDRAAASSRLDQFAAAWGGLGRASPSKRSGRYAAA